MKLTGLASGRFSTPARETSASLTSTTTVQRRSTLRCLLATTRSKTAALRRSRSEKKMLTILKIGLHCLTVTRYFKKSQQRQVIAHLTALSCHCHIVAAEGYHWQAF